MVSAGRCVCQQKSSRPELPSSSSACMRRRCQELRTSAVQTKVRRAGSKEGSEGFHFVFNSKSSAVRMPQQTRSTSWKTSAGSSGTRRWRSCTIPLPTPTPRNNAEAALPFAEPESAARSRNASKSPVPPFLRLPARSGEAVLEPNCRSSASLCKSPKISNPLQTSDAPPKAANISGVSPSAFASSATLIAREAACSRSNTIRTASNLPLSAARCRAALPWSSATAGSARVDSNNCTASK
mmetsp:Transcript_87415/g.138028  ORF Transcript_87415/g.138028 Transcript_87415/m.138028 type:complete len:240 (+) Transcript_87415:983-1702(+)